MTERAFRRAIDDRMDEGEGGEPYAIELHSGALLRVDRASQLERHDDGTVTFFPDAVRAILFDHTSVSRIILGPAPVPPPPPP